MAKADTNFKQIEDNTARTWVRRQLCYKGNIEGRNPAIIYEYQVIRILQLHEFADHADRETHQFVCVYRDAKRNFKCLFGMRVNCRVSDRNPDYISREIARFTAALLKASSRSPIGIKAAVVCQESSDFWNDAFQHKIEDVNKIIEAKDKARRDDF